MGAPNILFFDEPTNDLDIQTLTILEDYLDEFPGAVIVVSHDRYFLDRVADKIFAYEDNANIKEYPGNYSLYEEKIAEKRLLEIEATKVKENAYKMKNNTQRNKERPLKFSFKEKKEYEEIDEIIENIELELEEINEKINAAGGDYGLMQELVEKQQNLEQQLEEKMERWTYLNELAEKIANKGK